jgi:hypothetical protein
MPTPTDGAIRRALRRFTLGSGPLKRRSDRVQVLGRVVVVLSFLVAPPIAVAVATATTTHLEAVADAQEAARTRTTAILLEDAAPAAHDPSGYSDLSGTPVQVEARWTGPDGLAREGVVLARPSLPAGSVVPVWVDREGDLTRTPLDRAGIPTSAMVTATLPLIGVPVVTWTLYAALTYALDARRERRWEQDWAAVEPTWKSGLI